MLGEREASRSHILSHISARWRSQTTLAARTQRYAVLVAHRRCSKTVACVQGLIRQVHDPNPAPWPLRLRGPRPWPSEGGPLKNRGQPGAPEERPKLRGPAKLGEEAKLRTRPCGYGPGYRKTPQGLLRATRVAGKASTKYSGGTIFRKSYYFSMAENDGWRSRCVLLLEKGTATPRQIEASGLTAADSRRRRANGSP